MENFNVIELHRTRDFSTKISATFEFLKQNFRGLFKSILVIAGPPTLLASLIMGSFFSDLMSFSQQAATGQMEGFENYFLSVNLWMQIALMMLFLTVSGVMNIATINNYIILYSEKRTNRISVSEVWERVRSTFWMYFGTMFFFVVLLIAVYIVLLIPIGILAAISEVLVVFGAIFFICAIIYLIFGASFVFIIRGYEKLGFFESVARSFKLVKDKWWSTFGLVFLLYLIMGVISYLFMIPGYIVMFISTMHAASVDTLAEPSSSWQTMTIVSLTLYYLAQMLLASLPNVGIAFQYFNLVELKEAKGLIADIQTLGKQSAAAQNEDQY
jgi:hypothetical protein